MVLEKIVFLGAGGWFPAYGRQTATTLLRRPRQAVMIDAGTGTGRLVERPELLEGLERLDIVLTHFHLDHVAGLAYLPALGLCEQTTIWGPGRALYELSTQAVLATLSSQPLHPVALDEQPIEVRELRLGENEIGGIGIETRRQPRHSAATLGLRIGDALTWITDTAYDPASAAFARGSRLLAHETWFLHDEPRTPDVHSSAREAAQVAADAGVERLVQIHLPPFAAELGELELEAREIMPDTVLAVENEELSLGVEPVPAA